MTEPAGSDEARASSLVGSLPIRNSRAPRAAYCRTISCAMADVAPTTRTRWDIDDTLTPAYHRDSRDCGAAVSSTGHDRWDDGDQFGGRATIMPTRHISLRYPSCRTGSVS